MPIHDSARLRILEAYVETLKAENESLKRQLAHAEKWAARETAKAESTIAEFSAITKRLTAQTAERQPQLRRLVEQARLAPPGSPGSASGDKSRRPLRGLAAK